MPKVTVILTSFNHAKYLREAIDSVLNQTFSDFEMIIWDDASVDDSWSIIQSYQDTRIRTFRNDEQRRGIWGINKAITEVARGEYIAIHHSDDAWECEKLEKQVAFLDAKPAVGAVFTHVQPINEEGAAFTDENHFYYKIFDVPNRTRHEWLRYFFMSGNALCHPSVMVRKACYEDCGLYRFGLAQVGDFDMWIRLCLKYEIHILPEKLTRFRVRDNEANASGGRPENHIRNHFEFYQLLSNFLNISDAGELCQIFPEAAKFVCGGEVDVEYALAKVALDLKPFRIAELFGLNILFSLIQKPEKVLVLASIYDFGYKDFIHLSGKLDPFCVTTITERDGQIASLSQAVAEQQAQSASLKQAVADRDEQCANLSQALVERDEVVSVLCNSNSWRITRSLRTIVQQIKRIGQNQWGQTQCYAEMGENAAVFHSPGNFMIWLDKNKWRTLLRPIYMRFGVLQVIRRKWWHWKSRVTSKMEILGCSSDNLLALQASSNRRFDKKALLNTICVVPPIVWPEIDVSLVTYNSSRWIEPFIVSLVSQRYPLSKIHLRFVDHGSQDDTVLQLEKLLAEHGSNFASAKIVLQANLGFGAGHNRAIKEGISEYVLVANLDLEFSPSSLCDVVRVALSDKDGAVASWELRQIPFEHPKYYDPVTLETNWSSHACILIRRSAYDKVGGYDPYIFMYAEDVELSYRFRSHGYVLKYVPSAVVNHFTYESVGQIKPLQFSGSAVGNFYIRLRYGKTSDRLFGLFLYVVRFFVPSPFDGARTLLLKNTSKMIAHWPHFIRGKGTARAYFPLRVFDYEMTREGAFWEVRPCPAADVAPLVTIITRTYKGRGMFLEQAMQSVFNQTYPAIELLVVEDGGDSQQALVESLAERAPAGRRVRFLANAKLGRSAAGNAALATAEGHFIMFLDDDDLLFSDHVETLFSALSRDTMLSAAYALAIEVYTKVDPVKSTYVEESFHTHAIFRQEWDYQVLQDHNFIPIQAILFKRELYEQRGGFDTELDQLEDWNLWLRYGFGNQFVYVPKTTSLFRSPADYKTRSARSALLHAAYDDAKSRAEGFMEKRRGFYKPQ